MVVCGDNSARTVVESLPSSGRVHNTAHDIDVPSLQKAGPDDLDLLFPAFQVFHF